MAESKQNQIRFWNDPGCGALWNMAADSWMAEVAELTAGDWIVRVYSWSPSAITIGRNQSFVRAIDLNSLPDKQIAVRRVTGGRAIFHDESELTYAFAHRFKSNGSRSQTLGPGEIRKISARISEVLRSYLKAIGLKVSIERGSIGVRLNTGESQAPACFSSVARHEIRAHGIKVAAGAQRIIGDRYFQHGSIKLSGQIGHPALAGLPGSPQSDIRQGVTHNPLAFKGSCERALGLEIRLWAPTQSEFAEIETRIGMLDYRVGAVVFSEGPDQGDDNLTELETGLVSNARYGS